LTGESSGFDYNGYFLDPPDKPEDDGRGGGSPGPAFAMAMEGQASRGMTDERKV